MKTSKDPRHLERIKVMQELFSWQFSQLAKSDAISSYAKVSKDEVLSDVTDDHILKPISAYSQEVIDNLGKIDGLIHEAAPAWPTDKINKIDLSVLRLAVFELFFSKKAPVKVVVDEGVELAKEYGSEASPGFVNGVLGKLIEKHPTELN